MVHISNTALYSPDVSQNVLARKICIIGALPEASDALQIATQIPSPWKQSYRTLHKLRNKLLSRRALGAKRTFEKANAKSYVDPKE